MKDKLIFYAVLTLLLIGLAAGLLVKEATVQNVVARERQSNYAFLGGSAGRAESRAARWYRSMFVESGITQFTFDLTAGGRKDSGTDIQAVDEFAGKGVDWWNARMRVMWSIVFQFLVRMSNLLIWLPLAVLVIAPFTVDALVIRKVKSTNFALTSPHLQLFGVRAMFWIVLAFCLLQLLPIMVHPVWAPLAISAFALSTWIGISHFAKRA